MIVTLEQVRLGDLASVGGKAANLGETIAAGLPVPPGFVVAAATYRAAVTPVWDAVAAALAAGDHGTVRHLVATAPVPDGLAGALAAGLAGLGDGPVAVRSSATAEDLAEASFAGQQQTFLGVVGAAAVLAAVRRCWASAWADHAIAYRDRQGIDHATVDLAVVVQRLVPADTAGVLFTRDPVSGRAGTSLVDASYGLGESVVSGLVTPDSYAVRGDEVVERRLGTKQTRTDLRAAADPTDRDDLPVDLAADPSTEPSAGGTDDATLGRGTVTTPVPAPDQARLCLTDAQVLRVAALGRQVEAAYDRGMDVEWAFEGDRLWLLQARPITTPTAGLHPGDPAEADSPTRSESLSGRRTGSGDRTRSGRLNGSESSSGSESPTGTCSPAGAGWPPGADDPTGAGSAAARRQASRLSRWLHDDLVEHFPAPYPLDLAVVTLAVRTLLAAAATGGVTVADPDRVVTVDDDGIAQVAYPQVSLRGVPRALLRLARTRPVDPRTWDTGPGATADAAIRHLTHDPDATHLPPDPATSDPARWPSSPTTEIGSSAGAAGSGDDLGASGTGSEPRTSATPAPVPMGTAAAPDPMTLDAALAGLSDAGLAERFRTVWAVAEELLRARFLDYLSSHVVRGAWLDAALRLARRRDLSQYAFLGGLDYATAVIDRELHALATVAARRPALLAALRAVPVDPAAVAAADPGWWAEAQAFLGRHGARTTGLYLPFSHTSWREAPATFLATVGALTRAADTLGGAATSSPDAAQAHRRLVAAVAARLPGCWRPRFRRLVADYRAGHVVRERSVAQLEELALLGRRTALAAGDRLVAAGLLDEPADVRFLTADELTAWLDGDRPGDLADRVARRRQARPRAEARWWAGAEGGDPSHDGSGLGPSGGGQPGPDDTGLLLTGAAGSPGVASGPVRVVRGPDEFATLQAGDVLVCRFTDPSWTPLFALAAAVVADTGGRLSHAAIVAREYSIPAVLGVGSATTTLVTGQQVIVDGGQGTVRGRRP